MERIASVHIIETLYHIDREYDYLIPENLLEQIKVGSIVIVPFGKGNKYQSAVVVKLKSESKFESLKPISDILEYPVLLNEELMGLCLFIKERCFCTVGAALKTLIPPGINIKTDEMYFAAPTEEIENLKPINMKASIVYRFILERDGAALPLLISEFGDEVTQLLTVLIKLGYLTKRYGVTKKINEKKERYIRLIISDDEAFLYIEGDKNQSSEKQQRIINMLLEYPVISESELLDYTCCGRSVINTLVRRGIVEVYYINIDRSFSFDEITTTEFELSETQQKAYNEICELADSDEPKAALLYGITGSGKTNVIIKAVRHALSQEKQAIILVPEIGLTAQAVALFAAYFGERVALIHSALSVGERIDSYRKIADGKADVVIGTRSAIFAPLNNIGIIVIDEEQEHTYKSERTPKYHTLDIARYRCTKHKALMLLSSATPSVESFYKAQNGVYKLIEMTDRFGGAVLPEVYIDDLREDESKSSENMLGDHLKSEIQKNLELGQQTILLLNRRGYNSHVTCRKCGEVNTCPNCSISLTYHVYVMDKNRGGRLLCHYCGYTEPTPTVCSKCGSKHLGFFGYGTQRLEDELEREFPNARTLRMDADTTAVKNSHTNIYEAFKNGKADILYGTQMVAKGLDFPNVTLVGIILADSSLYMSDFRANERTFSLLTQVVGRAGRAKLKGRAVIQTYSPEHEVLTLASIQNYSSFYDGDIAIRKAVVFPPFCDIAVFSFVGEVENDVELLSTRFSEEFVKLHTLNYPNSPLIKFGPFKDSIYKINNKYRRRLIIKFKNTREIRSLFSALLIMFSKASGRNAAVDIDINPSII
ncbi:MAG: primosomal protein N' [Clostridiales bacterium GWF2_38_85]|nr:MAG: primosomal protein N' [Clostridiales bacterium GWF2_38_85]HBL84017.1 primosomal protein N' [Clostridiales bacterium]